MESTPPKKMSHDVLRTEKGLTHCSIHTLTVAPQNDCLVGPRRRSRDRPCCLLLYTHCGSWPSYHTLSITHSQAAAMVCKPVLHCRRERFNRESDSPTDASACVTASPLPLHVCSQAGRRESGVPWLLGDSRDCRISAACLAWLSKINSCPGSERRANGSVPSLFTMLPGSFE